MAAMGRNRLFDQRADASASQWFISYEPSMLRKGSSYHECFRASIKSRIEDLLAFTPIERRKARGVAQSERVLAWYCVDQALCAFHLALSCADAHISERIGQCAKYIVDATPATRRPPPQSSGAFLRRPR
jgi:hypothetical protein